MSMDGQGTKCRRKIIAEIYNRLSRVHERYRLQTTFRQTDDGRTGDSTISADSGPKFTVLRGRVEEILLLNKFFFRLSIRA